METVTIANGATKSSEFETQMADIVAIGIPSAMTGDALSFEVGNVSGSLLPLYDQYNTLVSVTIPTSRAQAIKLDTDVVLALSVFRYIKIVSDATEGAARTLTLHTRPL